MNIEVNENLSNWDKAMIDEIDDVLDCNYERYENGIDLSDGTKLDIAREVMAIYDFSDMRDLIMRYINKNLKIKLKMLKEKQKVCQLDKEEQFDLNTLKMWDKGELV